MTQTELFEHILKHVLLDLDALLNMDPNSDDIKLARAELLKARLRRLPPPGRQPENHHTPWTTAEKETLKKLWQSGTSVDDISIIFRRSKGAIASALVKLDLIRHKEDADSPRQGADISRAPKDSEILNHHREEFCQCAECCKTGPSLTLPFSAGLNFKGRWHTENGSRAEVYEQRKDGGWEGFVAGRGAQVWDESGRHEDSNLDLKDRVREGSKEAQGDWEITGAPV